MICILTFGHDWHVEINGALSCGGMVKLLPLLAAHSSRHFDILFLRCAQRSISGEICG